MSNEIDFSSNLYSLPFRAKYLCDNFNLLYTLLEIHCTGYLLILEDDMDTLYILMKKFIESILHTSGFEELLGIYPISIPTSLHSMGDDADIEWEYLNRELLIFKGRILEICAEYGAKYSEEERQSEEVEFLNSVNSLIINYRKRKSDTESRWLHRVQNTIKNNQQFGKSNKEYISQSRIVEIKSIQNTNFDFLKLVQICNEINICYENECYYSVAMLLRALLDHIPPIFGFQNFSQVYNNYSGGGKSFKKMMKNMDQSLRKIADSYLHTQIRKKESLPTNNQIDFSQSIDFLLAEIYRINEKNN